LQAAAWGDFVIAFYNPRSQKRDWQLPQAIEILLAYRPSNTPVAVAHHLTRPQEQISLTTLAELDPTQVDMFTLVLVGNSQSYQLGQYLITPRGYADKADATSPRVGEQGGKGAGGQILPCSPAPPPPYTGGYPITLTDLRGTLAAVVGGGLVGERKVRGLLAAGMMVRLVSPEATPQLQAWAESGQIQWLRRPYQPGDLAEAQLVFAATNQRTVNAQVAAAARQLGLLCNVADRPEAGSFHVPAVHRQPGLVVAVSTSGESPTQAKAVRDQISGWLAANEPVSE
jgi:cobalt-precorrin 5A hydrolase/precorrin-3B C17-methyltransferase